MKIGKLGEGVYLLTISPSGRTIKPAKMAKAVKKTQEQEDKVLAPVPTLQEELASMRAQALTMPPKDWWTASELAIAFGVSVSKIYQSNQWLAPYISKPDGKHYLYHRDVFQDKRVADIVKGVPFLPAASRVNRTGTQETRPQQAQKQDTEIAETKAEERSAEVEAVSGETNKAEPAESQAATQPIVVNRKVYCKELDCAFDSVTDGAKAIGVRREILSKSLRAGHKCHGFTFEYVDEENGLPMWNTVSDIARAIGLSREAVSKYAHGLPTGMVITKRDGTRLFHRDVVSDPIWAKVRENKKMTLPKAVFCEELGKTFPSLVLAANAIGVTKSAITTAIKRNGRCKGYHFSYV